MENTLTASRIAGLDFGTDTITEIDANVTDQSFGAETGLAVGSRSAKVIDGVSHNALGFRSGSAEGHLHTHVAEQWTKKCTPLSKLVDEINESAKGKFDKKIQRSDVRLTSNLTLQDGSPFTPDALESLAADYTKMPGKMVQYLLNQPNEQANLARYINTALENSLLTRMEEMDNEEKADSFLLARYRTGADGVPIIRGTKSQKYGVINNDRAMGMVVDALETIEGVLVSHFKHDGDSFRGNLLFPDYMKKVDGDSEYGTGVSIQNCELGTLTFKVMAFLFRAICRNGLIWNQRNSVIKVNKRHSGTINFAELEKDTKNAIDIGLTDGLALLDIMDMAKDVEIDSVPMLVADLSKKNGLTIAEGKAWSKETDTYIEQYGKNAFSLVNALTAAAQNVDSDGRNKMETAAASILTPSLSVTKDELVTGWRLAVQNANSFAALNAKVVQKYQ